MICGCCEADPQPSRPENSPGRSVVDYRIGTWLDFRRSMISAVTELNGLRGLTTRDNSDFTISLIEAWAAVLDILTFYQERIANEAWLRTATDGASVLELARSVGYELRPGVAAGTYLSFTVESAAGAPDSVRVDIGTKAQSIPAQDEKPQIFQTVEQIEARPG